MTNNEIRFYRASGRYGFLSNLYPATITDPDLDPNFEIDFKTSEHYYQYHKFKNKEVAKAVMQIPKARYVTILSHNLFYYDIVDNWNEIKIPVMNKALHLKFEQHQVMKYALLDTGNATLIEDSKTDNFWGCGKNGTGMNWLGRLLMELRDELKPGGD